MNANVTRTGISIGFVIIYRRIFVNICYRREYICAYTREWDAPGSASSRFDHRIRILRSRDTNCPRPRPYMCTRSKHPRDPLKINSSKIVREAPRFDPLCRNLTRRYTASYIYTVLEQISLIIEKNKPVRVIPQYTLASLRTLRKLWIYDKNNTT